MQPVSNIAALFSEGRYEEVLSGAARHLPDAAANPRAAYLKAQAHYHLGEYFSCAELVEETLANHSADAPLETRLQLGSLLAKTLMQQGEYESALEIVARSVPEGASAQDEYGETLLAGLWAAYFLKRAAPAAALAARIFEGSTEHFTCGRAALAAALVAEQAGDAGQRSAHLVKAHHHLTEAQNVLGNPEPIRTLYLAQVEIARHGDARNLDRALEEAKRLPQGARIARFVEKTVAIYRRHVAKESVAADVIKAVAAGVKRPWLAMLPGAALVAPDLSGESSDVHAAPAAVLKLREKVQKVTVRTPADATLIRSRRAAGVGTILHIEPDEAQAAKFAECLHDSKFTVIARVSEVDEALEKYVEVRPNLVVLDLLAPGAIVKGSEGATTAVRRFLKVDPQAKLLVTYTLDQKFLFMGAIRAGARAHVKKEFDRADVVGALHKASTSKSGMEALRVHSLELRRPIACTYKAAQGGFGELLKPWQSLVARSIDPMGIETALDRMMTPGEVFKMNIELPNAKPLHVLTEVSGCRPDTAPKMFAIRMSFIKLPPEAKAQLETYIADMLGKAGAAPGPKR